MDVWRPSFSLAHFSDCSGGQPAQALRACCATKSSQRRTSETFCLFFARSFLLLAASAQQFKKSSMNASMHLHHHHVATGFVLACSLTSALACFFTQQREHRTDPTAAPRVAKRTRTTRLLGGAANRQAFDPPLSPAVGQLLARTAATAHRTQLRAGPDSGESPLIDPVQRCASEGLRAAASRRFQ
eukprot:scaffold2534_cov260-Pinguiococcus_pyrenoidosus.AAC.6